ncbi:MAG: ABC transporter permease [Candidatus Kapabacteria bacterium]|jgi:ABC-2 type transport system permease protein|nr:ABC transporter permease [Candidatus Kapabacteria bacterium]
MLKYLIEKEFKQFFRNMFLPRLVIMLPFFATLIFPLVANYDLNNINVSIIDNDKSTFSAGLIKKIEASIYCNISNVSQNYKSALASIESMDSDIILEIPQNFEKNLINEKYSQVMISANTVNGIKGGLGSSYISMIASDFSQDIQSKIHLKPSEVTMQDIIIIPNYRYNPELIYRVYMIPAIMVMILALVCGFLPAINIVGEKENGTIEQMNVTPVSKFHFILAKLIPYWIVGYIVLSISFLSAWVFYGFLPAGSFFTLYFFSTLFVFAISGFGLVISNYARTIQQAIFMIFFFVITFIFMSGLYTPISGMPDWAKIVSNLSPLKYIIRVFRDVYLKGSNLSDLTFQLTALIGFAIFFNSWAIFSYRKKS